MALGERAIIKRLCGLSCDKNDVQCRNCLYYSKALTRKRGYYVCVPYNMSWTLYRLFVLDWAWFEGDDK